MAGPGGLWLPLQRQGWLCRNLRRSRLNLGSTERPLASAALPTAHKRGAARSTAEAGWGGAGWRSATATAAAAAAALSPLDVSAKR
jgi:hypothetical protein